MVRDTHAQEQLTRTHREVEQSLSEARVELASIASCKPELEAATDSLRALVAATVRTGVTDDSEQA